MKQNRLISIGAFISVLALSGLMTGCMEKDVYDPNREKEPLPDPDKYFGFEMRSDVRLSVNYDIYGYADKERGYRSLVQNLYRQQR